MISLNVVIPIFKQKHSLIHVAQLPTAHLHTWKYRMLLMLNPAMMNKSALIMQSAHLTLSMLNNFINIYEDTWLAGPQPKHSPAWRVNHTAGFLREKADKYWREITRTKPCNHQPGHEFLVHTLPCWWYWLIKTSFQKDGRTSLFLQSDPWHNFEPVSVP